MRRATWPAGSAPEGVAVETRYKVVETSDVTDTALEEILNEWTGQGWRLDGIQFAMREASKRPAMAFVVFTRPGDAG
jgi:hypothetical protein